MSTNLFVGNLSFDTTADDLLKTFGLHGTVTSAEIIADRDTGRSRGFGFVEMTDGADAAISNLNGTDLKGRSMKVNEAKAREERPRSGRRY